MKRSGALKRKSPLLRTGIRRGQPLKRGTGLRAQSSKRRQVNAARRKLAADHLDEPCRLRTPVCTGWAEHFHELVGRAQGGSLTDRRNLVPADDACNSYVEDHPAEARRRGWKVPAWHAVEGDGGLVPEVLSPLSLAADDQEDAA